MTEVFIKDQAWMDLIQQYTIFLFVDEILPAKSARNLQVLYFDEQEALALSDDLTDVVLSRLSMTKIAIDFYTEVHRFVKKASVKVTEEK